MNLSMEEFDDLLEQAIDEIDPQFRDQLDEVPVIVEETPSENVCKKLSLAHKEGLLGLFEGVALNRRVNGVGAPSQITLYRQNILAQCHSRNRLKAQIRKVLIHELGHYLGFTEQQLRHYHY